MKKKQDYIRDIAEIRSMMERSSKFLSLSGWAGILAGVYALSGVYIAHSVLKLRPLELFISRSEISFTGLPELILLAIAILILSLVTAVFLSYKRAGKRGKKLWDPTAKQLLVDMMVPLVVGGFLLLFMIFNGLYGLLAPFSLLFYGLALFNAGRYTYQEVKILGFIEIILGLLGVWFVEFGILFWALGFGVAHIIYGIHMNYKYER